MREKESILENGPSPSDVADAICQHSSGAEAKHVYVTGVGWCWIRDGEIIEVIHQEGLDI